MAQDSSPRLRIRVAARRYGERSLVLRCLDLLAGSIPDVELLDILGGTSAVGVMAGREGGTQGHWPRVWPASDGTYRRSELTTIVGRGDSVWERAKRAVLRWGVKTASGFVVDSPGPVTPGERVIVTARVLTAAVVEPVEVVAVVEETDRVRFAYRTLPGHPVR